ncbi:MAG: TIGR02757 family protein [Flavobacteriaceae bacterium]|nr:MAG: TIGR02757 family protein [Flavobacteriaceae bacterium]
MKTDELKEFLDHKVEKYNTLEFIDTDPIQIPHRFSLKEDIEISGFLTATIAWGNRKSILKNADRMMDLMDNSPFDFVMNHKNSDLKAFKGFVHRTFNSDDLSYFIKSLHNIYVHHNGLENVIAKNITKTSTQLAISKFKEVFFELEHQSRTTKHIGNPLRGSAAKRLNMWLRWNCRKDKTGVDFGIWNSISPSVLSCPLDVHSGNVARKLGLLLRKQNDSKALNELDISLRNLDPIDPVKYDFALFGLGVFESF